MLWVDIFCLVLGYAFGSVPFGLLVGYAFGAGDIRKLGSGNIGTTNVLRSVGKAAAACALVGDAGKGAAVVALYNFSVGGDLSIWVGLAAVVGHSYSVWLGFRGGKGVATSFGMLAVVDIFVFVGVGAVWLAVFAVGRISSLAALVSFASLPVWVLVLAGWGAFFWGSLLLSAFIFFRHRDNIGRLMKGEEKKIGFKK